jgi:hypothetical protein
VLVRLTCHVLLISLLPAAKGYNTRLCLGRVTIEAASRNDVTVATAAAATAVCVVEPVGRDNLNAVAARAAVSRYAPLPGRRTEAAHSTCSGATEIRLVSLHPTPVQYHRLKDFNEH